MTKFPRLCAWLFLLNIVWAVVVSGELTYPDLETIVQRATSTAVIPVTTQAEFIAAIAGGSCTIELLNDILLIDYGIGGTYDKSGISINGYEGFYTINGHGYKIDGQCAADPNGIDPANQMRCLSIQGPNVVINDLTITRGCGYKGGGLYVAGSATVTMTNCVVSSNIATSAGGHGAGLYISGAYITMVGCDISSNTVPYGIGGAMYVTGGYITLVSCTVSLNSAEYGGGIYVSGAVYVRLVACYFYGNTASVLGYDVYIPFGGVPEPEVYSGCSGREANAGAGTLQMYCERTIDNQGGCNSFPPADLRGDCSPCAAPAPYACCGSITCSSSANPVCTSYQSSVCPLPTFQPTLQPTLKPTREPTSKPTLEPTFQPSLKPSPNPTFKPSFMPTFQPSPKPSPNPTFQPTPQPSARPTLRDLVGISCSLSITAASTVGVTEDVVLPAVAASLKVQISDLSDFVLYDVVGRKLLDRSLTGRRLGTASVSFVLRQPLSDTGFPDAASYQRSISMQLSTAANDGTLSSNINARCLTCGVVVDTTSAELVRPYQASSPSSAPMVQHSKSAATGASASTATIAAVSSIACLLVLCGVAYGLRNRLYNFQKGSADEVYASYNKKTAELTEFRDSANPMFATTGVSGDRRKQNV